MNGEGTSEGIDSGGPYRTHARVAGPRPDAARTGWTITLVAAVLIAVGIAVELARVAPGWLVPFACVALVTIMSLMATVRQQRWVDLAEGRVPMPEEPPSEPPGDPGDEAEMVRPPGVAALVLGALFWVIAMLFVLGGAFFIVVGIVCSGMGGGMH